MAIIFLFKLRVSGKIIVSGLVGRQGHVFSFTGLAFLSQNDWQSTHNVRNRHAVNTILIFYNVYLERNVY
jgi:hypothetical protein